ncbi:MAG: peptide ABC transporter substrate-binding protein, partial [Verrucomicrobia bacterium]|nr:peptide ABC transporter substrate-binding protein [Verrucomicrobiota bacterium]
EKLKSWIARFPHSVNPSIFTDLYLLYSLNTERFLAHRHAFHLFRLIISLHLIQKKLLYSLSCLPDQRQLEIRWIPTSLVFPFTTKPVLGCLIGFNMLSRFELFDEENILLSLQKHLPQLKLVEESPYCHTSQHKNLKLFYFEIEEKSGSIFSIIKPDVLKESIREKIKISIQSLTPTIFMKLNEEEHYKHIITLSQEIRSLQDQPQVYITLEQQTEKEIIFRIILVYISPFHNFPLKKWFFNCTFVHERTLTVKHVDGHPVEAHVFCLHLPREASILRSNGALDFYAARKNISNLIRTAIGEFRDYNGGIIIQQQDLLGGFFKHFPECASSDPELIETFFYAIVPVEKQVVLSQDILSKLFIHFLENRHSDFPKNAAYVLDTYPHDSHLFLIVYGEHVSIKPILSELLQELHSTSKDIAYAFIDTPKGLFLSGVFLDHDPAIIGPFLHKLKQALDRWQEKRREELVLRIGMEHPMVSLDPRIAGDTVSGNMLKLLFEGLTRFDQNGNIENAVAESIAVSPDLREYVFKLRSSFWNDGSSVSAHDFVYAWKKILAPDFETTFAHLFYPIKNAREVKEGALQMDALGIQAIDDFTLKVELINPTAYFLQLLALPIYSPVNRLIDEQCPQWPYQSGKSYPCNGPFQLKMNEPCQGYQLVKNPLYWNGRNLNVDQITMTIINPAHAIQALQRGELDWIGNPMGDWYPFFNNAKEEKVVTFRSSGASWCMFNTIAYPFHHVKLRQAFAYAIQRSKIIEKAYLPLEAAYSPLLPHLRQSNCPAFPEYDLMKAQQLFQEALRELNITKESLSPVSLVFQEKGIREYTAKCLQEQFQECFGIECELKPLSRPAYFDKMASGDFQMGLALWTSLVDDPSYTLNAFKSPYEGINFGKWEHLDFQRALKMSEQVANPFQRSCSLIKAEEILCDQMPIVPLYYQPTQLLVKKELQVSYRLPCGPFCFEKSFIPN